MRTKKSFGLLSILLASAFGAGWSQAQNYPAKPIRILAPGSGGSADVVTRVVAAEMIPALGQQMIIENRPSNVAIAVSTVGAAPDGYTIMVNTSPLWIAPLFAEQSPGYDALRDLSSIVALTRAAPILVVHPSVPANTVAELISLAKAKPGSLNISTGGVGGSAYVAAEVFKSMAGVNIVRIGYKAQAQEDLDLISGVVQVTISNSVVPLVKAGKLRALAIASSKRSTQFPDLPTVGETVPGFLAEQLVGFWAPAKTPDAIVRRLNQEAVRALEKPEVRQKFLTTGMEAAGGTPEQLSEHMKADVARVSKMIKDTGLKPGAN